MLSNDALMTWLFIGLLKRIAFNWFRSFQVRSLKSWVDLEGWFLAHFYEDDTEMSMPTLIDKKKNVLVVDTPAESKKNPLSRQSATLSQRP